MADRLWGGSILGSRGLTMKNNGRAQLSIILLTLNEEHHMPGVLKNICGWAEEVFIVDSLSTDRTVDIAFEYGVKIVYQFRRSVELGTGEPANYNTLDTETRSR